MFSEFLAVLQVAGETVLKIVPISIALGIVFALLTHWSACNPGHPWWRKREIVTDVCYWFLIPLGARFVRIGLMVMGAAYIYNIHGADALIKFYDNGFGPLAAMPLWAQALTFVVVSDFLLYWFHRALSWRRLVEIPRGASFIRRTRLDLGGALSSGQYPARHRHGRCRAAAGRHFAECDAVGRAVHHRLVGLRACQSELDAGAVQIRDRRSGLSPLASHRARSRRLRAISPAPSRSGTCCSAPSTCRRTSCRTPMASTTSSFPESFGAQMLYPFRQ